MTSGGPPANHLAQLGIRILAASNRDLNWWLKFGPGKRLRNIAILHLCSGDVKDCQNFKRDEEEVFHTDGIRMISFEDIISRTVDWWKEEPGKAVFEASRDRMIRERVKEEENESRKRRNSPARGAGQGEEMDLGESSERRDEKKSKQSKREKARMNTDEEKEEGMTERQDCSSSLESDVTGYRQPKVKGRRRESGRKTCPAKKESPEPGDQGGDKVPEKETSYESDSVKRDQPEESERKRMDPGSLPASSKRSQEPGAQSGTEAPRAYLAPLVKGETEEDKEPGKVRGEKQRQNEEASNEVKSKKRKRSRSRRSKRDPDELNSGRRREEDGCEIDHDAGKASSSRSKAEIGDREVHYRISLEEIGETETEAEKEQVRPRVKLTEAATNTSQEWRLALRNALETRTSYSVLGRYLEEMICGLDTPLGDFVREHSNPRQPPPHSTELCQRKGNLLPIHPSCVEVGMRGVTAGNISWLRSTLCCLNFHFCAGSARLSNVPMDTKVSDNQKVAIQLLGETISRNIVTAERMPSAETAKEELNAKSDGPCGAHAGAGSGKVDSVMAGVWVERCALYY